MEFSEFVFKSACCSTWLFRSVFLMGSGIVAARTPQRIAQVCSRLRVKGSTSAQQHQQMLKVWPHLFWAKGQLLKLCSDPRHLFWWLDCIRSWQGILISKWIAGNMREIWKYDLGYLGDHLRWVIGHSGITCQCLRACGTKRWPYATGTNLTHTNRHKSLVYKVLTQVYLHRCMTHA